MVEDYNTYIEVDPGTNITINSATELHHDALQNSSDYLYKDFGAGYFKNFTHELEIEQIDPSNTNRFWCCWNVANDVGDWKALLDGNKTYLSIRVVKRTGFDLQLLEINGGVEGKDETIVELSEDTPYYLTIKRAGTSFTCDVYSDSARKTLVRALSLVLTIPTSQSFRYLYATQSYNNGVGEHCQGEARDLDLGAGLPMGLGLQLAPKGGIGKSVSGLPAGSGGGGSFGG